MRKNEKPSSKQAAIIDFIREFKAANAYSPSIRDIQAALGISSTSVVDYNLKALVQKGLIRRAKNVSRTIELVEEATPAMPVMPMSILNLPLMGTIAAGQPITVFDAPSETVQLTTDFVGRYASHPDELFVLKVKGQSMIEDLINDGDLVVLHRQDVAENGETVAAWLEEEKATTLKRIYREDGGRIRLQPANSQMEAIYTDEENLRIQGRLVAVIRQVA